MRRAGSAIAPQCEVIRAVLLEDSPCFLRTRSSEVIGAINAIRGD